MAFEVILLRLRYHLRYQWSWTVQLGTALMLLAPQFLALAVGLSLILCGWSSLMLAIGLRSLRPDTSTRLRALPE
jgi:hypothetical protein